MTAAAPYVRIDADWTVHGHRVITLENEKLRVDVLPALGAKIYRMIHKATETDLLWHNPRLAPREVPVGASYDDHFSGGWDDLFPNDAAGRVGDDVYPDHGELWCRPWTFAITRTDAEAVELHLVCDGVVTNTRVEKWLSLRRDESVLRVRYRITNRGPRPLDFLWKLHPALAIDPGDRIDVPGRTGELVDRTFSTLRGPDRFAWPVAQPTDGSPIDLSVVPSMAGTREFVYVRDLEAGWCALRRMRRGVGFGLVFPRELFTSVWLFMTFGGWRGLETVVLEPCTAYPKDLAEAIRTGHCAHLEGGSRLDCEVAVVIFDNLRAPRQIHADGKIDFEEDTRE